MAVVTAVNISERKGVPKHEVDSIELKIGHGIVGDAHAGDWHRQISLLAEESIERLSIKTPSIRTPMNSLSGGNQQKVLFARWLLTEPEVLLLDEPTRGIDVGAKYEIYTIMADLAAQGKCVVMISSEMPELIGMADRVMVMCEGKKAGELEGDAINEEEIMRLATKFMV